MPANVEVKAQAPDPDRLRQRLAKAGAVGPMTIQQEDTFFRSPVGRLKLRRTADGSGELIYYERSDSLDPTLSRYFLAPCPDADSLRELLSAALGERGTVRKERTLYLLGQTRVHLDEVEGLGSYVELEVVLEPDQSPEEGARVARRLMKDLEISEDRLVRAAYIDLLEERG
jgi:predicted adenylyl cyclase CyaB